MEPRGREKALTSLTEQIEGEQAAFLRALENELARFFESQQEVLGSISAEVTPLLDSIRQLSTGGKRLRALLCYWGWRGAGGAANDPRVVRAGAAIELFQSAALIHDDIIDRSATRRGAPAVHKQFENMHAEQGWRGDRNLFGMTGGIIAGDLCLSWSEAMFSSIGTEAAAGFEARRIFDLMRTEVMAGQYLDVLGEVVGSEDYDLALSRAHNVIRYKSAKYSCEHPLALGGALAQELKASQANRLVDSYRAFALPLGEGFQLRDDVLGVFGAPEETGKPAGDDLKEGKRTVLVALTEKNTSPEERALLNDSLGKQDLSLEDIEKLRSMIEDSGALAEVEKIIAQTQATVSAELNDMELEPLVKQALEAIVAKILHRAS